MGPIDKKVLFVAMVACFLLAAAAGWTTENSRQAVSTTVNLADVDPVGVVAQERPLPLRRPETIRGPVGGGVAFSEDFQVVPPDPLPPDWVPPFPADWAVIDNDGLVVHPNVAQFTDAWIVAEDFGDATNFAAMSTSWYSPAGTSDDWMISPDIILPANSELLWRGNAPDPAYPDGYKVYVSTTGQSMAGCQANPELFSIAAESGAVWTDHTASLAGYPGETVNICFQNNSTDQFILMIDDVVVRGIIDYDASVTVADQMSEYGRTAAGLPEYAELGGTVKNVGVMAVTNVILTATVLLDGSPLHVFASPPIASLGPDESSAIVFPDVPLTNLGVHSVEYTVTIDETDGDPTNDTALAPFDLLVTPDQLGRDDGVKTGTLGIGPGTAGELGTQFTTSYNAFLEAAVFNVGPYAPPVLPEDSDIVGDSIYVNLREMVGGVPGAILATTEVYTFVDYDEHLLTLNFVPPVALPAGDFMLGVVEEDDNIVLGTSTNIFTPGTGWIDFDGNPLGDWANNEDFGEQFEVAFMLRAVLTQPVLTVTTDGTGTGTVVIQPLNFPCGAGCSLGLPPLLDVTLVPTPDPGSVFGGWTGDGDCTDGAITMTGDLTCNATFISGPFTLTVSTSGSGSGTVTSSPTGIDCGADCSEAYFAGTPVNLTATPDGSWSFMGWSGDADCLDGQVTMNSDVHCDARFELPLFVDGFESGDLFEWNNWYP